jgi:delta-aminolevulinic acid dehydratase/porphobilinogen synthase
MKRKKRSRNKSAKREMISRKNVHSQIINVVIVVSENSKKQTNNITNWKAWFIQILLGTVLKK